MSEEEKAIYFDKKVVKDQKDVTEDSRFWVIVLSTVFTLYVVACLLSMFCRVKKANFEIVSEVQVISDNTQKTQMGGTPSHAFDVGVIQSPGKMTVDPGMDVPQNDITKAPSRPVIDDLDDDMKGFKKASKALTAYGQEQRQAEIARAALSSAQDSYTAAGQSHGQAVAGGFSVDDGFENDKVRAMKELLRRDNIPGQGMGGGYQSVSAPKRSTMIRNVSPAD